MRMNEALWRQHSRTHDLPDKAIHDLPNKATHACRGVWRRVAFHDLPNKAARDLLNKATHRGEWRRVALHGRVSTGSTSQ